MMNELSIPGMDITARPKLADWEYSDCGECHFNKNFIFTAESLAWCIRYNPGISYNDLTANFTRGAGESWKAFREAIEEVVASKAVLVIKYDEWVSGYFSTHYFWVGDASVSLYNGSLERNSIFNSKDNEPLFLYTYDPFESKNKNSD